MKFLTDAQFPQPLVELLRKVDWDARTAYEEGTEGEADDSRLIIHSRNLGRVFLTFDTFRAESGARVAAELILRGGKVVQIRGGPEQPLMKALGRLLFHHPEWHPFLAREDGVAAVSDIRNHCKLYTPHEYAQTVRKLERPTLTNTYVIGKRRGFCHLVADCESRSLSKPRCSTVLAEGVS